MVQLLIFIKIHLLPVLAASRFPLFVIIPDWLAIELRDNTVVGGILCLIIGVTLVIMEIGQIGLTDWRCNIGCWFSFIILSLIFYFPILYLSSGSKAIPKT